MINEDTTTLIQEIRIFDIADVKYFLAVLGRADGFQAVTVVLSRRARTIQLINQVYSNCVASMYETDVMCFAGCLSARLHVERTKTSLTARVPVYRATKGV